MASDPGIYNSFEEQACDALRGSSEISVEELSSAFREVIYTLLSLECTRKNRHDDVDALIREARPDRRQKRDIVLFMIRCLPYRNLLLKAGYSGLDDRALVGLAVTAAPDLCQRIGVHERQQTYESYEALNAVHSTVLDSLSVLERVPPRLDMLNALRADIGQALNSRLVKSYVQPYGYERVKGGVDAVSRMAAQLAETRTQGFQQQRENLLSRLESESAFCRATRNFLTWYYSQFISRIRAGVDALSESQAEQFECGLSAKRPLPYAAEKRYPMRTPGRSFQALVPVVKSGVGVALDVRADIRSCTDEITANEVVNIGDIHEPEFPLAFEVMSISAIEQADFEVKLSWRQANNPTMREQVFKVTLRAQEPDIDWPRLARENRYSLEVAGEENFVGRAEMVDTLSARILRKPMQSSYITGQKRVGKTSLAQAVVRAVEAEGGDDVRTLFLEWGDYAYEDPNRVVAELGVGIGGFLNDELPGSDRLEIDTELFSGSLAPLNRIATKLQRECPRKRFLIILDEFDEIHPELYRYGRLAETFFANLRTLSSKSNVAFLLVGGENMPFIMGAQGDQLNKFAPARLDYFANPEEWADYCDLVEQPTKGILMWYQNAVNKVYSLTDGHPFYTNLLCGEIYKKAVSSRDTDVTERDVAAAAARAAHSLPVNPFAHLWKDGISATKEESEAVALRRARLLTAVGRVVRRREALTTDRLESEARVVGLRQHFVLPLLRDFFKRHILVEREEGRIAFRIPLFRDWLGDGGANQLISDTLGDEISDAIEKAESEARVTSAEILDLVEAWSPYRGQMVGEERVRKWLEQRGDPIEQRLLFKVLQAIRFVGEAEARRHLKEAYDMVSEVVPYPVWKSRNQKRADVLVSYADGEAKSGQLYAARFAEENRIRAGNVIGAVEFARRAAQVEEQNDVTMNGVVFVDDLIATGRSLVGGLEAFLSENLTFLMQRSITLVVVPVLATDSGLERVNRWAERQHEVRIRVRPCIHLDAQCYAFTESQRVWETQDQMEKARTLCRNIGYRIYRNNPLGYGGLELVVVLSENVPNNTLPILHSRARDGSWEPLFERLTN